MGLQFIAFAICIIAHLDAATESVNQATVVREIWNHVRGDSIQNLLADVRFPHKPSKVTFLRTFDAPTNDGFHFAQRLKGYFIAPKTGEYKFYSSCDDECEVFLGLDGKEGESNRIISQKRSSMHNEFDRYPDQVSHSIYLEQGKSYYVEEIGRQDKGRESLSLGIELPDGKRYFPIPRKFLSKYNIRPLPQNVKPNWRKAKKKHRTDTGPSEMIEGSLGKPVDSVKNERKTTAKGEKKSIKSDDYPEDSKVYSDRDQTHAILEVDGAEIEQPENINLKDKGQDMFAAKPNSRESLDEFEISPRLELSSDITSNGILNEAGIEKAVEEALKQRSDKSKDNENEVSFLASDKHDAETNSGRHRAEASNQQSKQISQESNLGTNGNATVLELNKIASEAGQVAMNLVNVSNFKVVIPGGKTYQISGVPGAKPLVTVVPDNGKEKTGQVIENITESGVARMNKVQDTPIEKSKANYMSMDTALGKTVTAIQHGNNIDVHVDKTNDNKEVQQLSQTTQALKEQNPSAADSQITSTQAPEHPYPILDSSVAALMYQPEHVTMEHPPVTEHPINDHHEHHIEDMHIKVNSSFPEHEAPKPQKLDPEVIKVEFLPEGISVDTSSSKIAKKCEHDATKRDKQPFECNDGKIDAKSMDNKNKADNSKEERAVETGKANTKTISDQFSANSNKIIPGKFTAAQETKMFVAPAIMKGVPDDVTVVPAERQEAITRVLVQDIAKDRNESNVNLVKVSPVSKISSSLQKFPVTQQFPTITGSVMNNRTGNPVPFEVKVVSNQKEAQELAGGKGANFTISADSRTYASGIAAGPNKKGQQQTIIVLPDIYQRHTSGGSKDTSEEESTKESGAKSIAQQHLPSPETKTSSAEKTYPVTMDTPPPATGGGGAGGEFIFPDLSTLNPSSGPSLMPITGGQESPQSRQHSMPGMEITPGIPQQQQQQGQDKVLIGPPDNIYHGPILSPVASEFMEDLNKGSFSTEEALDLMNNYVSGSQDMTSSIKKLAERLGRVSVRDDTQQKLGPSTNLSPQKVNGIVMGAMNGHQNFINFPRLNEPQSGGPLINSPSVANVPAIKPIASQQFGLPTIGAPSGGEIAALLAIGPNRDYAGGEMNERFEKNFPSEQPNQRSFNAHSYRGNNEENFDNYNENHQQQALFNENQGGNDAAVARMNQLQKDKPPPLHLFEGEEPGSMMQLPNENNNVNMFHGGRQGAQIANEGPISGIVNNPINSGLRGGFMPFMQNIPRGGSAEFESASNVDGFLNRIDPHEMSPNPSVAMPENGLARHTLSKRPSQQNQPYFESDHLHSLAGEGKFHEGPSQEYQKQASIENFHTNHGSSISDMYSDSLFPEDIADIESLRGSLQGKTLSAYDRQEERQSQAQAQGRSETHPNKMLKVSYPLTAVTQPSKFKGSVRSHIAERMASISMKKNPSKKKRRHHWKKAFLNGLQRSTPFKAQQKKEKRDLVSIVPNHRPIKSVDQSNDIILKAENVGISTPDKDESLKPNAKVFPNTNVDGRADTKDSMTGYGQDSADNDKSHLKKIAMELKDIINQLHNDKKKIFDIWEGQKLHEKPIITNRVGSDYEVEYVKGKVTDEDLREKSMSPYQSPDAEKFQQDVWEPGSRGEGTMLGALVNSKRGILAKIKKPQNEIGRKVKKSGIANENQNNQPYFMDWKLDDEIRLLQQL